MNFLLLDDALDHKKGLQKLAHHVAVTHFQLCKKIVHDRMMWQQDDAIISFLVGLSARFKFCLYRVDNFGHLS